MNYQVQSYVNRMNRYTIAKPEDYQQRSNQSNQRSSSGKKITFIRRKISNPSKIQQKSQKSNIFQKDNNRKDSHIKNSVQQKGVIYSHSNRNLQNIQNIINIHPEGTHLNSDLNSQNYRNSNKQTTLNALQISRGEFYQQQLDTIQKDVHFFRSQLQRVQIKNKQLEDKLKKKANQFQIFVSGIYSFIDKLFSNQIQLIFEAIQSFVHAQDKIQFKKLMQKSSGVDRGLIGLNELQNDMMFIIKTLNFTLLSKNHYQQILQSQQITTNDHIKQLNLLKTENYKILNQNRNLQKIIELKQNKKIINISTQTLIESLKKELVTADQSRQELAAKYKNTQVQTQEKRIGSAASIHKYKSFRFYNTPNGSSPYKNNLYDTKISSNSKQLKNTTRNLNQQVSKATISKKKNVQKGVNMKDKKNTQKKKYPVTSSYINHLIQSQNLIKGQQPVESIALERRKIDNNGLNNSNIKSQLSIRRPIHRSRSHSQQQVPSSGERSNSKCSVNNISSRVYSTYSLNPFNQYGEKRFCNQVNGKRIRKITQLSEQSEQLQQRMRQLMQQQNKLKQKYKQLQKVKVSRQNKKSRLNKSIDNKKPYNLH